MEIVGRREPMYRPRREVEEAVYDYFASGVGHAADDAAGNAGYTRSQRLRCGATNRCGAGVSFGGGCRRRDGSGGGAKAAAVVETLDEVAGAAGANFQAARDAVRGSTVQPATNEEAQRTRRRAANACRLDRRAATSRMAPRDVRLAPCGTT